MNTQHHIASLLHVKPVIDPSREIRARVDFLKDYLRKSGCYAYVLGISGGVDSSTAGMLVSQACNELEFEGYEAKFIAVRLPYGIQRDEEDAQHALFHIQPDEIITVNIEPASNAILASLPSIGDPLQEDFVLGNIKARQRMVAQYAIAGANNGLVIGTDHAAEALMGFYTKFGDGACDVTPLTGLNKRQVRQVAKEFGLPDLLVFKTPTADLESLNPGKPDEDAFGVSYEEIDNFLECKIIDDTSYDLIFNQYMKTMHKRELPVEALV